MSPTSIRSVPVRLVLGLAVYLATFVTPSHADIRYHGFNLDDRHRIMLEEEDGTVRLCLWTRGRAVAGRKTVQADVLDAPDFTRFTKRECLVEIRSEVIRPTRPNGVNNPGDRYRIWIETKELMPAYSTKIEVDAAHARGALFQEFRKLQGTTEGIYRDVLYYGAGLAATVLSDSKHFPAMVPGTAQRALGIGEAAGTEKAEEE